MMACQVKQMSKDVSPVFSAPDVAKIRRFSQTNAKVGRHDNRHHDDRLRSPGAPLATGDDFLL